MNDCGLRGLALLDAAIAQIEAHPETWHQADYRCGSGMCVAGWVCELAGGKWLDPDPNSDRRDELVPEDDDRPRDIATIAIGPPGVWAYDRAIRLTGLPRPDIFCAENDLADIKRIRNRLVVAGEIS